jgi:hypothetical protein
MRRLEPGASTIPPPPDVAARTSTSTFRARCRAHLAVSSGEAEHRQVTVAFVKLSETDELIAATGPRLLEPLDTLARRGRRRLLRDLRTSRGSSRTSTSAP